MYPHLGWHLLSFDNLNPALQSRQWVSLSQVLQFLLHFTQVSLNRLKPFGHLNLHYLTDGIK